MPEKARLLLDKLITQRGENYALVSQLLGRNAAYIQQYIKRGVPTALSADDQDKLAEHFGVPREFLRDADADGADGNIMLAIAHVAKAISLCERDGLEVPACHLQMGLDLLEHELITAKAASELAISLQLSRPSPSVTK